MRQAEARSANDMTTHGIERNRTLRPCEEARNAQRQQVPNGHN